MLHALRGHVLKGALGAVCVLGLFGSACAAPPAPEQPSGATVSAGFQLDAAQTGAVEASDVSVPDLSVRWSATFPGQPSYAVISHGLVLVTARSRDAGYGTTLHALSVEDGQVQWSHELGGTYWWSALTVGGSSVFALNYNGVLRAFDLETGNLRWQQQMPQYSHNAPPVERDGIVYVSGSGSGGTLSAVDAQTGGIIWNSSINNGSIDAPSVDSTGVYSSHVCDTAKFSLTGERLWSIPSGCSGGGAKHATLDPVNRRLYVRQYASSRDTFIADADTGEVLNSIVGASPFALHGRFAYSVANGVVLKIDPSTGLQLWSMGGDVNETLVGAPVVVNGTIILGGTSGKVYGIDASTGARVLTIDVGSPVASLDEQNVARPPAGTAVGHGLVTVTTSDGVVALGSAQG